MNVRILKPTLIDTLRKYAHKALNILLWIVGSLIALSIILILLIQLPQVQHFIVNKAENYLEKKLQTKVDIGGVYIGFPKSVVLKDIYIEDQKKDTLVFIHKIDVNVDLLGLLSKEANVSSLEINKMTAHVKRTMPDSAFNFDFITKAFSDSTAKKVVKDTTSSGFSISFGDLNLKDIYLTYIDEVSGIEAYSRFDQLKTSFDSFDLEKRLFDLDDLLLKNATAKVVLTKKSTEDKDTTVSAPLSLGLNKAILENVSIDFEDKTAGSIYKSAIGNAEILVDAFNLSQQYIKIKSIKFENTNTLIAINKDINKDTIIAKTDSLVKTNPDEEATGGWNVKLAHFNLKNNTLKFDNFSHAETQSGMDFSHLAFSELNVQIQNISYQTNNIDASIKQIALKEKSGFELQKFTVNLHVDSNKTVMSGLDIKTVNSRIKKYIAVQYSSLSEIADKIADLGINTDIQNSYISLKDILYFSPDLKKTEPFKSHSEMTVVLSNKMSGTVDNLHINYLTIRALNTYLNINGQVKGLPNAETAYYNIHLSKVSTNKRDISIFLPANTIPENINLPSNIALTGNFKGKIKDFNTDLNLNTSLGNANLVASMNTKGRDTSYTANIIVDNLQLGKLIKGQDSLLGPVSMKLEAKGNGLSPKTMNVAFKTIIDKAVVKGYAYKNLRAKGTYIKQIVRATALMQDENIDFVFDGTISLNEHIPTYNFVLNLHELDLKALHFTKEAINIQGNIFSNITATGYNDMNGTVGIKQVLITKDKKKFYIDSLLYAAINTEGKTDININSDILIGYFRGNVSLKALPIVLKNQFGKYFNMPYNKDTVITEAQNFEFALTIHNSDILTDLLVPGLTKFHPGKIEGSYDSRKADLKVHVDVPLIVYNGMELDSANFDLKTSKDRLNYDFTLSEFSTAGFVIQNAALIGKANNDTFNTVVNIKDNNEKKIFQLSGMFTQKEGQYRFALIPEGAIFNYQPWQVSDASYIEFGSNGIYVKDFTLTNGDSMLSINSIGSPARPQPPLNLDFKNFSLSNISTIAEGKQQLFRGLINGNIKLENLDSIPAITADMSIKSFSFKKDTLGDIAIEANNKSVGRYAGKLTVTGYGNQIVANGFYDMKSTSEPFDFAIDIDQLKLTSIQPYLTAYLSEMNGNIKGKMRVNGTFDNPDISGHLDFPDAGFTVNMLGSHFMLNDEKIIFDKKGIRFPNFTLTDSAGHKAKLNGYVYANYFDNFKFDLSLNTSNFQVINAPRSNTTDYYGKLLVSTNLSIGGDMNLPIIEGKINIRKGTDFSYILPNNNPQIVSREGVVDFVDMDTVESIQQLILSSKSTKEDSITKVAELQGIDMNINLVIAKDAVFNLVVDPLAGDHLQVSGSGALSFAINPSGAISLVGQYNIDDGIYELSFYDFVRRKFQIKQGSTISWFGSPTDAQLDLTAFYETRAAPLPLIQSQTVGLSDKELNQYKQKLPVEVQLYIKGQLMQPEISMTVILPPEGKAKTNSLVISTFERLKDQPSEANKQVFALLVKGGFIAEDPFSQSSGGGGVESAVASSVSDLLGMQLNKLAGQYLKGVDVNVNLNTYEDYSSGTAQEKSDLNVGLSKQFLDDRLSVSVGSNINVYGQENSQQNINQIVGDVNLEYKLTPDGKLRVNVFRNDQYEGIITGEVIETGVGLIFMKEYNHFKQLFKKSKKKKEEEE